MRNYSVINSSVQDLLNRNQKLVLEINKLQNENRLLKKKISTLQMMNLQLKRNSRTDMSTQTEHLSDINKHEMNIKNTNSISSRTQLKSEGLIEEITIHDHHRLETPTKIKNEIESINTIDESEEDEYINLKPSKRSSVFSVRNFLRRTDLLSPSRKKNDMSQIETPLPDITSLSIDKKDIYVYNTNDNDGNNVYNNKENIAYYKHENNESCLSYQEQYLNDDYQHKQKCYHTTTTDITTINNHPAIPLSSNNNTSYSHNKNIKNNDYAAIRYNNNILDNHTTITIDKDEEEEIGMIPKRTPRSTKKPLSYQETPLNVKVRKGFQFFKFA